MYPIASEFTVKRSKWHRGQGAKGSKLLRDDGTMCCVGFLSKACGASDAEIINRNTIATFASRDEIFQVADINLILGNNLKERSLIYNTNDCVDISDTERE